MSQSRVARFPQSQYPEQSSVDNNPEAAHHARQRIAALPNPYINHAAPAKENLIGAVTPVSPAAQPVGGNPEATTPVQPKTRSFKKPWKHIPSQLQPFIIGGVTFALLFLLFKSPIFISQLNYLTQPPKAAEPTEPATAAVQVGPDPVITIPKINVNAPIVFAKSNIEAAIQKDLENGVVHYANTALPGQNGNSVIFGHSSNDWWEPGGYKFVFVLLDKLQIGDTFTVNYNSQQYLYEVYETKVVEPTDLSVLNQPATPEMTLITCSPPGTSWKRLIVRAKQIHPAPSAQKAVKPTQTTTATDTTLPGSSSGITETIGNWWQQVTTFFGGGQSPAAPETPSGTLPGGQ